MGWGWVGCSLAVRPFVWRLRSPFWAYGDAGVLAVRARPFLEESDVKGNQKGKQRQGKSKGKKGKKKEGLDEGTLCRTRGFGERLMGVVCCLVRYVWSSESPVFLADAVEFLRCDEEGRSLPRSSPFSVFVFVLGNGSPLPKRVGFMLGHFLPLQVLRAAHRRLFTVGLRARVRQSSK